MSLAFIGLVGCSHHANTPTSYAVGEGPAGVGADAATANTGPVRMAHVSLVQGNASWRPSETEGWSQASVNTPVRQGAQVSLKSGQRAELQFDDGSHFRLGGDAVASLVSMYSDDKGEFTEIKLNNGLATLDLGTELSVYQIDTPFMSVKAHGPCSFRIGVGQGVELSVYSGTVDVDGQQGRRSLRAGDYIHVNDSSSPYVVEGAPQQDNWDQFNSQRSETQRRPNRHVPSNIALVSNDLEAYGDWQNEPNYGEVWYPRNTDQSWRPYHDGRWVWVSPVGWTWVSNEPWGWAPYHYGTWVHGRRGWGWVHGPAQQYWSPAVVQFTDYNGSIGWCALAPREVRYPSSGISIGFRSGDWAVNFSIGGTGVYYPAGDGYCEASPWQNEYVNRTTNVYNITNISNSYNQNDGQSGRWYGHNNRFVSMNADPGATFATRQEFVGGGGFHQSNGPQRASFQRGLGFTGTPNSAQYSGPMGLTPNRSSFTASRTFRNAPQTMGGMMGRPIMRSEVPESIGQRGGHIEHLVALSNGQQAQNGRVGGATGFQGSPGRSNAGSQPNRGAVSNNAANRSVDGNSLQHPGNGGANNGRNHDATGTNGRSNHPTGPPIRSNGNGQTAGGHAIQAPNGRTFHYSEGTRAPVVRQPQRVQQGGSSNSGRAKGGAIQGKKSGGGGWSHGGGIKSAGNGGRAKGGAIQGKKSGGGGGSHGGEIKSAGNGGGAKGGGVKNPGKGGRAKGGGGKKKGNG